MSDPRETIEGLMYHCVDCLEGDAPEGVDFREDWIAHVEHLIAAERQAASNETAAKIIADLQARFDEHRFCDCTGFYPCDVRQTVDAIAAAHITDNDRGRGQ